MVIPRDGRFGEVPEIVSSRASKQKWATGDEAGSAVAEVREVSRSGQAGAEDPVCDVLDMGWVEPTYHDLCSSPEKTI